MLDMDSQRETECDCVCVCVFGGAGERGGTGDN